MLWHALTENSCLFMVPEIRSQSQKAAGFFRKILAFAAAGRYLFSEDVGKEAAAASVSHILRLCFKTPKKKRSVRGERKHPQGVLEENLGSTKALFTV